MTDFPPYSKNSLRSWPGDFLFALSFLSRLAPGRAAPDERVGASLAWYPAAGLAIGLALWLPFAIWSAIRPISVPWAAAWLYSLYYAFLTRALHLDGLADLMDAMGSGKQGPAFTQTLKDSRLGAFGALGLILGVAGQIVLAQQIFSTGNLTPLIWAPVLGRSIVAPLAATAPPSPISTLGRLVHASASKPIIIAATLFALLSGFILLPTPAPILAVLLCLPIIFALHRFSRRAEGLNGDFFGAAVFAAEICALASCAIYI